MVTESKQFPMIDLNTSFYRKTDLQTWTGRNDGDQLAVQRWHQRIILVNLLDQDLPALANGQKGIALIGFSCDEGVRRNGGRVGAKEGPLNFRKASCNLPVHFEESVVFLDLGDIICDQLEMEKAQENLAKVVSEAISLGYQPLVIGGGHEVAYGHYSGINLAVKKTDQIGIINFDAHFDLREQGENGPNSGTGFLQIANNCKSAERPFRYLPIGIQRNGNTKHLFDTAAGLAVNFIGADQFQPLKEQEILNRLNEFIAGSTHIYLTICLDVFSSAVAPGVSAAAFSGLFPDPFFFSILSHIVNSGKLTSMDIAELNPAFDQEERTAKLAAALAFCMVNG